MDSFFVRAFIEFEMGIAYPISIILYLLCMIILLRDSMELQIKIILNISARLGILFLVFSALASLLEPIVKGQNTNIALLILSISYALILKSKASIMKWAILFIHMSTYTLILVMSSTIAIQLREIENSNVGKKESFDITCVFVIIFMIFMLWLLKRFDIQKFEYAPKKYVMLIILVAVFSITIFPTFSSLEDIPAWFLFIVAFIIWIIELVSYLLFYVGSMEYIEKMELLFIQQKAKSERENYQHTMSNYEEMKMLRHELKNYFTYAASLLEQKKYEDLDLFFSGLKENELYSLEYVECGNTMVNNLMNSMLYRCEKLDIAVEYNITISPELNIRESELYSLLANLIENAMEASGEIKDATIEIKILSKMNQLFIKVSNTIDRKLTPISMELKTTKQDKQFHGYGTKIIKMICEKNDGYVNYKIEDGRFVAEVMITTLS